MVAKHKYLKTYKLGFHVRGYPKNKDSRKVTAISSSEAKRKFVQFWGKDRVVVTSVKWIDKTKYAKFLKRERKLEKQLVRKSEYSLYMVFAKSKKTKKEEPFYQVFVSVRSAKLELKNYYKKHKEYRKTHYAWKIKKLTSQQLKNLKKRIVKELKN